MHRYSLNERLERGWKEAGNIQEVTIVTALEHYPRLYH
jgi:hypothetical protein